MSPRRSVDWRLETATAPVSDLLGPWPAPADVDSHVVRLGRVSGHGALVLGSAQRDDVVDRDALAGAGLDLCRRLSGGGAVVVGPGDQVWVEAWVPRESPLWDDDIVDGASWMGDTWYRALSHLGVETLHVHRGRATGAPWSGLVCFAGLGPGELSHGRCKVMGLSQRRSRAGARFQTCALRAWQPSVLCALLGLDRSSPGVAAALDGVAVGLDRLLGVTDPDKDVLGAVEEAVVAALP